MDKFSVNGSVIDVKATTRLSPVQSAVSIAAAYKVQLTQEQKPLTAQRLERPHENADYADKIIFSEEANFHRNAFVNRQNCG